MIIHNYLLEVDRTREEVEVFYVVTSEVLGCLCECHPHVVRIGEPLGVKGDDGWCHLGELEGVQGEGGAGRLEGLRDAEGGRWQVEEGGERDGQGFRGRRESQVDRGEN